MRLCMYTKEAEATVWYGVYGLIMRKYFKVIIRREWIGGEGGGHWLSGQVMLFYNIQSVSS